MSAEIEKTVQFTWPFVAMGVVKLVEMGIEKWGKNAEHHLERDRRHEDQLIRELSDLRDDHTILKTESEIQARRMIRLEEFMNHWRDKTVRSSIALRDYLSNNHGLGSDPVVHLVLDPLCEMPSIEEIEL